MPRDAIAADLATDVAVVGGGLVGACAALAVAATGRTVVLIEREPPRLRTGSLGMDARTVALSVSSRRLLAAAGAWSDERVVPFEAMHVWEERGTADLWFRAGEAGVAELGWIAEVSPLLVRLWDRLAAAGVRCVTGTTLTGLEAHADEVTLEVAGTRVHARLVLAADGARSMVRERLGTGISERATGQSALATVVRTERPHARVARQRFLTGGPLALLPGVEPNLVSIVWSQTMPEAQRRAAQTDVQFREELYRASGRVLGRVEAVSERFVFPLTQHVAARFDPHPRVLLIGDAARVVHPLAGLGVNLGFEDVASVVARVAGLTDPGANGAWRGFARRRRTRALAMVQAMSLLANVYERSEPAFVWLRNAGVRFVDGAGGLKRQIMLEAMGLGPLAETARH